MNRESLIKLLGRHFPFFTSYPTRTCVDCECGKTFESTEEWARHVTSAIYPG